MSAWGKNGSARSCEALLRRIEENDPNLTELVILPLKKFGSREVFRIANCLESGRNTNLKSLQASGHAIEDYNALEALGRSLADIETLAIGDSNMGDEGVRALCRGMESNERTKDGSNALTSIDLSWKDIGEDGLKDFLRVSTKLPLLQSLDLSRNEKIGPAFDFWKEKTLLALPMQIFPSLTYLDLSGCRLDTKSCTSLLKAMQLDLNGLNGDEEKKDEPIAVRNLLLKLSLNNLNDPKGIGEMMNLLARAYLVSELQMSRCQIGDEGLKQIVDECRSNSLGSKAQSGDESEPPNRFLQRLDLSHNDITSVSYLANALHISHGAVPDSNGHYFSYLRTLNLSGNPLGQDLVAAIECNPRWIISLEELDLSHTSCEVSGAVELIRGSNYENSVLKRLNLFGNKLGTDGFVELSKVLGGGHLSLEYLDLGGNGAAETACVTLLESLKAEKMELKLRVLVIGGNSGGTALEQAVKEVMKVHPNLDIARDKPKQENRSIPGGNMMSNMPGTTWAS